MNSRKQKNLVLHSSHFALNWRCCTALGERSSGGIWKFLSSSFKCYVDHSHTMYSSGNIDVRNWVNLFEWRCINRLKERTRHPQKEVKWLLYMSLRRIGGLKVIIALLFWTSVLDRGGQATSRPGRFTHGKKSRYLPNTRLGGPPRAGPDVMQNRKNFLPLRM